MFVTRHLLSVVLTLCAAAGSCIYLDPYSLHQVIHATYQQFDMPPDADGIVRYSSALSVDFRLPESGLSSQSAAEIRQLVQIRDNIPGKQLETIAHLVQMVRGKLNTTDGTRPPASVLTPEELYRHGLNYYCLCSDSARLLNVVLQVAGFQSRIVWMEGHVVVEYFDSPAEKWVFLDPHLNLSAASPDGIPMSVSQLIYSVERDLSLTWQPLVNNESGITGETIAPADHVWYRNVLLNGECHCLSGETLTACGRWNQLLHFRSCPQVVLLNTPFDTSKSGFASSVRVRSILFLQAVLIVSFWLGRSLEQRLRGGLRPKFGEAVMPGPLRSSPGRHS